MNKKNYGENILHYLKIVYETPLLNAQGERMLSKIIKKGQKAKKLVEEMKISLVCKKAVKYSIAIK